LAGCAVHGRWVSSAAPRMERASADDLDCVIIVVGDAGEAEGPGRGMVLDVARHDAAILSKKTETVIVFVGDNVYPDPSTERASERLDAQIDVPLGAGVRGVFALGNHDYRAEGHSPPGTLWERDRVTDRASSCHGDVRVLPDAGSIGPAIVDIGTRARLAVLDTERWLDCAESGESEIGGAAVYQAIQQLSGAHDPTDKRHLIVIGHHPTATHGPHGGFYAWQEFLWSSDLLGFPLPLLAPLIYHFGSDIAGRNLDQNLHNARYERFRNELDAAMESAGVLAYVAGHEHALQWISNQRGGRTGALYQVVSGAGSPGKLEPVGRGDDTLFVSSEPGFVRLEFHTDGSVMLEIVEVLSDGSGQTRRATFRMAAAN